MRSRNEHPRITPKQPRMSKNTAFADRAQASALELPGVLGAAFTISGSPTEPVLHVDCRLAPNQDYAATMQLVADLIVEDLECSIGIRFLERHLDFRIAEPSSELHETSTVPGPFGDPLTTSPAQLSVAA